MVSTPLPNIPLEQYFIECCRAKLVKEYLPKIEQSLEQLTNDDVWWRAYETNNSIGNIMLHLTGNIRQWAFHHLGGNAYERNRDKEFSERTHIPKEELLTLLRSAVLDVDAVLKNFQPEKLKQQFMIQRYSVTGLEAILHITEHFSYHTGQIIYIAKLRTGKDLKFYDL